MIVTFPQAETSLYAELDKLSAAWEALDRQVKGKVFDLTSMEERLAKMAHDVGLFLFSTLLQFTDLIIFYQRAKSENKFYAAMRDKEAIEIERKNVSRNLEKQAKLVERLQEYGKGLSLQIVRESYLWYHVVGLILLNRAA